MKIGTALLDFVHVEGAGYVVTFKFSVVNKELSMGDLILEWR